ncbi:MAG TPA: hypothetical protein EYM98_06255 [Dehalococcoidia bacterium]|nr:hypothetical protein [Dehalococcoidia bacterium]
MAKFFAKRRTYRKRTVARGGRFKTVRRNVRRRRAASTIARAWRSRKRKRGPLQRGTVGRRSSGVASSRGLKGGNRYFPETRLISMRYVEVPVEVPVGRVVLPVPGCALGVNKLKSVDIFSMTNMHDPNPSQGGHQPMMIDIFKLMYQKYLCVGALVTVRISWKDNAFDKPVFFALFFHNSQTLPTNLLNLPWTTLKEQVPGFISTFRRLDANLTYTNSSTQSAISSRRPEVVFCKGRFSLRKQLDVPKKDGILTEYGDVYGAKFDVAPTSNMFCHLLAITPYGCSPQAAVVNVEWTIDYKVLCHDLVIQTAH